MMPRFGILISRNDDYWWSYCLIIDHKIVSTVTPFTTPQAAIKAALHEANLKGHYDE